MNLRRPNFCFLKTDAITSLNMYNPGSGTVVVKPLSGQLTHDTDTWGKMDPYVKISIGPTTEKTKTCSSGGKFPSWSDSLTFNRTAEDLINIEVWDKDTVKDDLVGQGALAFSAVLSSNNKYSGWVDLTYKGKSAGKILLEVQFFPSQTKTTQQVPNYGTGMQSMSYTPTYQPTTYQPTTYQPTTYQPTTYQPTTTTTIPMQTFPTQSYPTQYPTQTYPTQSYPTQTYPTQTFPTQTYPTTTYPTQTYPTNTFPTTTQTFPTQSYPTQTYPTQTYPTQSYPTQIYPTQSYPTQSYPTQTYPTTTQTFPTQSYPMQQPTQQGYPGGYGYPQ